MEYPPPQSLTIELSPGSAADVQIVRLNGPLTINNVREFQEVTRREPSPRVLLIDLKDVPYLDSAALGTFVSIHVACEEHGRKYALVNANSRLMSLFDLSSVSAFLVIYDSLSQAETALV